MSWRFLVINIAAIALASCYELDAASEESPFGPVEISNSSIGKTVDVRLREDVSESEVLDPGLFGDFWPSITHSDAFAEFGNPLFVRRTGVGVFHYYRTPSGVVEVGHEESRSWGVALVWRLRAYPTSTDPDALLHSTIAKHISTRDEHVDVILLNPNGTPGKVVKAKNGKVLYAMWINDRDQPK